MLTTLQVGSGFTEMKRVNADIKSAVFLLPTTCPERRKVLKELDHWKQDPVSVIRQVLSNHPYKPNTFLRRHPMYCGLWIHYMRTRFH